MSNGQTGRTSLRTRAQVWSSSDWWRVLFEVGRLSTAIWENRHELLCQHFEVLAQKMVEPDDEFVQIGHHFQPCDLRENL